MSGPHGAWLHGAESINAGGRSSDRPSSSSLYFAAAMPDPRCPLSHAPPSPLAPACMRASPLSRHTPRIHTSLSSRHQRLRHALVLVHGRPEHAWPPPPYPACMHVLPCSRQAWTSSAERSWHCDYKQQCERDEDRHRCGEREADRQCEPASRFTWRLTPADPCHLLYVEALIDWKQANPK